MRRALSLLLTLLITVTAQAAQPLIQVDMILFLHQSEMLTADDLVFAKKFHGIPLLSQGSGPYHLLPRQQSDLAREYYALSKRPEFQIMGQYSWIQPAKTNRPVLLEFNSANGWKINGEMTLHQNQYYLLNGQIEFNLADKAQIRMNQRQRLKSNTVYYLDHPQAGMLIKIHPVA
jgi:hypothetical protein